MSEQPQAPAVPELQSQPAVMTATIQITRAGTGKVETHTLTFTPLQADEQPTQEG